MHISELFFRKDSPLTTQVEDGNVRLTKSNTETPDWLEPECRWLRFLTYHCYLTTNQSEGPWAIMHMKTVCLVFKNPSLKATGKFIFFFFFECELPILLDWHPYFGAKTTIKSLALWDFPGGPLQGTWVQSLVREDPTCHGATKPSCSRAWVLQQEKAPKWEAHTSKLDSGPHLQQWEKAQAQQERPSTTKKKERKSLALCEVGTLTLLGYNMVIAFITLPKRTLPYTFQ